jgi:hypothetical protein
MEKPFHPKTVTGQVLMFLAHQDGTWATWGPSFYMPSVQAVFRIGTSEKAQFRFMRRLQEAGLVRGCDCGCRGDYTPTRQGLEFLANECFKGELESERWKKENRSFGY